MIFLEYSTVRYISYRQIMPRVTFVDQIIAMVCLIEALIYMKIKTLVTKLTLVFNF